MFRTVLTSLLAVLVLCGSAFAAEKTLIAAANPVAAHGVLGRKQEHHRL